jgi:peptidoglycan/LPS O-acetylase OafA/YrhL
VLGGLGLYLTHHAPWLAVRVLGGMMFSMAFSLFLFGSLFAGSLFRSLFENWPLQLLGCMCYSIYAWHGIVMNDMIPPDTSLLADALRLVAPFTVLILALSALSYRYIEFGHRRDWKALFLLAPARPAPSTSMHSPVLIVPAEEPGMR